MTGSGESVLVRRRSAPANTVVVAFWVLLARLVSLLALMVAVALMVPAATARQVKLTVRAPAPLPSKVPMLQVTSVALVATQLALAGDAETKVAPLGTLTVSTVLVAALASVLSMPTA
jgi:hypothetical protein